MRNHTIKLFGPLKELFANSELIIDPINDSDQLRLILEEKYPQLNGFVYSIAVNQEIATTVKRIRLGDELALLPPFAGG